MDVDVPPPPYSQIGLNPRKLPYSRSNEISAPLGYNNSPYLLQSPGVPSTLPILFTIDLIDHQSCLEGSSLIQEPIQLCFSLQEAIYSGAAPCEIYRLQISPLSRPQDFPYCPQFSLRNITEQDWTAFLNFLLPTYITSSSLSFNTDKGLKAKWVVEEMDGLYVYDSSLSGCGFSSVSAQIAAHNQLSHHSVITHSLSYFVEEWNTKYFAPRGLKINFIARNDIQSHLKKKDMAQGSLVTKKSFFPVNYGLKIGPVLVDRQGIRIGQVLVVDQNGFRLGGKRGIHAGVNQLTIGGKTIGRTKLLPRISVKNPIHLFNSQASEISQKKCFNFKLDKII